MTPRKAFKWVHRKMWVVLLQGDPVLHDHGNLRVFYDLKEAREYGGRVVPVVVTVTEIKKRKAKR